MSEQTQIDAVRERARLQREELARKLDEIRLLLSKADARLREDPENRRRWMTVVENLEASLAEVKARLEQAELELKLLETRATSSALPGEPGRPGSDVLSESGTRLIQSVLKMPLDDVTALNIEALAHVHAQCQPGAVPEGERVRALARVELANQMRVDMPREDDSEMPSRRSQLLLRSAINKIQTGRVDAMTADEVRITVACHELMVSRVNPSLADKRLARILGAAISVFNRKRADQAIR
jgi:hypothetical protein